MFAMTAVVAKGCEDMSRAVFGFQQETAEQAMGLTRRLLAAKTLREVVDVQSQYSKSLFDGFLAEGSKFSELGLKVANDAMTPIAERVNVTVETLSRPIAA
jgi:phasin family protein